MRRLNVFDRNTTLALLAKQTLTDVELELIRVIDHLSGLRAPDARANAPDRPVLAAVSGVHNGPVGQPVHGVPNARCLSAR